MYMYTALIRLYIHPLPSLGHIQAAKPIVLLFFFDSCHRNLNIEGNNNGVGIWQYTYIVHEKDSIPKIGIPTR